MQSRIAITRRWSDDDVVELSTGETLAAIAAGELQLAARQADNQMEPARRPAGPPDSSTKCDLEAGRILAREMKAHPISVWRLGVGSWELIYFAFESSSSMTETNTS